MAKRPFFSIIVVCYNAGEELCRTITSILEQKYRNYEVIVKDGESTDGSFDTIPQDERIRAYSVKDCGIYDAMNQAAAYVQGEYVLFLNCGDYFYDADVLEKMHAVIRNEADTAIYYGNIYERKTGNHVQSNPHMDAFGCYRNVPCHQCCFYPAVWIRPQELQKLGRDHTFYPEYRVRADYEHFLWCFFIQKAKTVFVPVTICSYEGGGFSETKENRRRSVQEHKQITAQYMRRCDRMRYRLFLLLTLAPLRTRMAQSRHFSAFYQRIKKMLYKSRRA